jgi:hypothetical protein
MVPANPLLPAAAPAPPAGAQAQPQPSAAEQQAVAAAARQVMALPPEQRAAAYDALVPQLQAAGYAKNAPAQYPGDAVMAQIAGSGTGAASGGAPASAAASPAAPPATGLNSPQVLAAQEMLHKAAVIEMAATRSANPQTKALAAAAAAELRAQAQIQMQADVMQPGTRVGADGQLIPGDINLRTNEFKAYPVPPSPRMLATPGGVVLQSKPGGGAQVVYTAPLGAIPPTAPYDQQAKAYNDDKGRMPGISTSAQTAQSGMMRLNELANIIPQLATGPVAELRTRGAAWLESLGASPETIKAYTGMASGSLAEELIKLSVATVGQAAKADLGSNVGIQSLQLYQSANPGISLLPDANKKMTNMARVAAQMTQDYASGAQQHFNANQSQFLTAGKYAEPLSVYDAKWQQQNNAHIGAGAMGILNGDSFDKWALRLSPEEAKQAAAMAYRIDPTTMVPTAKGMVPAAQILGIASGGR